MSTRSSIILRSVVAAALALAFTLSGASAQDDLDPEAIERGRVLFAGTAGGVGCAVCHARFATGEIGPDIRGASLATIQNALRSVPDMEFLSLTSAELDDIVTYLAHLGRATPAMVTVSDGNLSMTELKVASGSTVQLIVTSRDGAEYLLLSESLGDHPLAARAVIDLFWTAPAEGGTFTVELADDMGVAATLVITATTE